MPIPAQAQRTPRPGGGPRPIHYSWVIVGILVVVQVIGSAISQSAGIMVAPLRDPHGDFGWGIGTIGALMAVYYVVGARLCPGQRVAGRAVWGAAPHAGGRAAVWGSMLLLGLVRQPWHFLLTFSVLLSLTQSICMVPLIAAVSGWFRRRLGLATGILWAAGGLGAAGLAPLVSVLLDHVGLAGHLLEPRDRRRQHHPVADAPLPQSPRGPGPHALWGDCGRPARGGAESGDRAAATAGLHPAHATHARLLVPCR